MTKKQIGRPELSEKEQRKEGVRLWLTTPELEKLRKEHEGLKIPFAVFCREKLLNQQTLSLRKPIPADQLKIMSNLLKLSGSFLLLSKKSSSDIMLSAIYQEMAKNLREIVKEARFTANELIHFQSETLQVSKQAQKVNNRSKKLEKQYGEDKNIVELMSEISQLNGLMIRFLEKYNIQLKS